MHGELKAFALIETISIIEESYKHSFLEELNECVGRSKDWKRGYMLHSGRKSDNVIGDLVQRKIGGKEHLMLIKNIR